MSLNEISRRDLLQRVIFSAPALLLFSSLLSCNKNNPLDNSKKENEIYDAINHFEKFTIHKKTKIKDSEVFEVPISTLTSKYKVSSVVRVLSQNVSKYKLQTIRIINYGNVDNNNIYIYGDVNINDQILKNPNECLKELYYINKLETRKIFLTPNL